jgi:hypothetical protein
VSSKKEIKKIKEKLNSFEAKTATGKKSKQ